MMRALADDQVVTHFVYDGNNERVLKLSETWHRIFTNSEKSGEDKDAEVEVEMFYTLYPNQYMVIRPDGNYTKHYYMGAERIASKIGDPEGYLVGDPTGVMLDISNNTRTILEGYVDENYAEFDLDIKIFRPDAPEDPTLGMSDSGTASEPMRYFFHKDQVGSSSFITDGVGQPIQFIGYTPFGESFINVSATHFQTPYRFNGKEQEAETGLYNYGARYYDPKISRWMSVDPAADEYPNTSPYVYVLNNPINAIDPDGRRVFFVGGAGNDSDGWNYMARWASAFSKSGISGYNRLIVSRGKMSDVMFTNSYRNSGNEMYNTGQYNSMAGLNAAPSYSMRAVNHEVVNDAVGQIRSNLAANPLADGEQLNLGGYSYGSVVQAQAALKLANEGTFVDNLILIGSPVGTDSELYEQLSSNENIGNIIRWDIDGDKLSNPSGLMDMIKGGWQNRGDSGPHFDLARPGSNVDKAIQGVTDWLKTQGIE